MGVYNEVGLFWDFKSKKNNAIHAKPFVNLNVCFILSTNKLWAEKERNLCVHLFSYSLYCFVEMCVRKNICVDASVFWIVCMHKQREKGGNLLKCAAWHFRRLRKKWFG